VADRHIGPSSGAVDRCSRKVGLLVAAAALRFVTNIRSDLAPGSADPSDSQLVAVAVGAVPKIVMTPCGIVSDAGRPGGIADGPCDRSRGNLTVAPVCPARELADHDACGRGVGGQRGRGAGQLGQAAAVDGERADGADPALIDIQEAAVGAQPGVDRDATELVCRCYNTGTPTIYLKGGERSGWTGRYR
jgi:hypothetical protein